MGFGPSICGDLSTLGNPTFLREAWSVIEDITMEALHSGISNLIPMIVDCFDTYDRYRYLSDF